MKVDAALEGTFSLLLDTAPVIYHLERNPRYAAVLEAFFWLQGRFASRFTIEREP